MNQKIKKKVEGTIDEIDAAIQNDRKFDDLDVLGRIKKALGNDDEKTLRDIWSNSFDKDSRFSFWHYLDNNGEEFWQVFDQLFDKK